MFNLSNLFLVSNSGKFLSNHSTALDKSLEPSTKFTISIISNILRILSWFISDTIYSSSVGVELPNTNPIVIITLLILGTFLLANNIQSVDEEPTPTITIGNDDDKKYASRRRGKGPKGRKRGGSGLR